MTPENYYEAFTLGNYNDFIVDSDSVRKAFNVAVAANHLADCYFNYHKENNPDKVSKFNIFPLEKILPHWGQISSGTYFIKVILPPIFSIFSFALLEKA